MKKSVMILFIFIFIIFSVMLVSALPDLVVSKLEKNTISPNVYIQFCVKNIGSEKLSLSENEGVNADLIFSNNLLTKNDSIGLVVIFRDMEVDEEECGNSIQYDYYLIRALFDSKDDRLTFKVILDPENRIDENDENNNVKEIYYTYNEFYADVEIIEEQIPTIEIDESVRELYIVENINNWIFNGARSSSSGPPSEIFPDNPLINAYLGDYKHSVSLTNPITMMIYEFSSDINNRDFLEKVIEGGLLGDFKFKIQKFKGNSYFYGENEAISSISGATSTQVHYVWYNGNKIVYMMFNKNYYLDYINDLGEIDDILTAYFEKYPSEVVAPPGLIQIIIDFFRKLFGG